MITQTRIAKFSSRQILSLLVMACIGSFSGCAALTNPVANGVPVRILPEALLAESNEGYQQVPLALLRQPEPAEYKLDSGDTLGIYIEGILGSAEIPPPVNVPDVANLPPSIGYPFPIRKNGTISLPYVGSVNVAGLTIEAAEQKVIAAYLKKKVIREEDNRVLVTLMRPRQIQVLVIREDSQQRQISLQRESLLGLGTTRTTIGGGHRSTGQVLELPAYKNDVLNVLTRTGGLPGLESTQEVIIQRGGWNSASGQVFANEGYRTQAGNAGLLENGFTRIPLRMRPGEQVQFTEKDIILHDGDIVTVKAREPQFYYTGGLLPASENPLPNNYDLTVVEAVLKGRGPLLNGGINSSNLNGAIVGSGVGNPSPSLLAVLRKTPNGGQVTIRVDLNEAVRDPRENILVKAGDILVLQETPGEAFARYISRAVSFNIFGRFINRADATGSASVNLP